jgi:hypothetical protein
MIQAHQRESGTPLDSRRAGDAGSADAVAVCDDTMPTVIHSRLKHLLVAILARVFGRSPLLAIALGHVVTSVWRGFREV